jgi:lipoate-protein ligase A
MTIKELKESIVALKLDDHQEILLEDHEGESIKVSHVAREVGGLMIYHDEVSLSLRVKEELGELESELQSIEGKVEHACSIIKDISNKT